MAKRTLEEEIHTLKQRLEHVEDTLYELFSGFEAAQKVKPKKRPKR